MEETQFTGLLIFWAWEFCTKMTQGKRGENESGKRKDSLKADINPELHSSGTGIREYG